MALAALVPASPHSGAAWAQDDGGHEDGGHEGGGGNGNGQGNGGHGLSLSLFCKSSFDGPWSFTVPTTAGPHADAEGSVRSVAVTANGYRDFDSGGKVTPFVTLGLGLGNGLRIPM